MERINLVTKEHGALPSLGIIDTPIMHGRQGMCIATIAHKQKKRVFFSIPGAQQQFIEVHNERVTDGDYEDAIERGMQVVRNMYPKFGDMFLDFHDVMLKAQRAKKVQLHRDYLLANLAAYKVNEGKDWK